LIGGVGNVAGYDLTRLKSKQIPNLRRELGDVFQDFKLLPDRTIDDNLKFVLKSTGWKNKKEIGFIAEELAEIFPELVENDENGNPTSVNYTRAVTVLFDGFKQMYKELKEIKEKIK
jgi:ABC-type methionine transport system ATPase subunit